MADGRVQIDLSTNPPTYYGPGGKPLPQSDKWRDPVFTDGDFEQKFPPPGGPHQQTPGT